MRLRERLAIRQLAEDRYAARSGEQYQLQALADIHGEDAVLDWLSAGTPTPALDGPIQADLLDAGVTVERYRWLISSQ